MVNYDICKELKGIRDRMYGTNFEQDRIIIEDAIEELEKLKDFEALDKACMDKFGFNIYIFFSECVKQFEKKSEENREIKEIMDRINAKADEIDAYLETLEKK